jgi:hypothetical protein
VRGCREFTRPYVGHPTDGRPIAWFRTAVRPPTSFRNDRPQGRRGELCPGVATGLLPAGIMRNNFNSYVMFITFVPAHASA